MARRAGSTSVPKAMQERYEEIVALTDAFCQEKLDEEHAALCREAVAALARKRPSPLATGKANNWACGVVYAVGSTNFIFDKANPHYMSAGDLASWFGLTARTGGTWGRKVRDLLDMSPFDHRWMLPSHMADSTFIWMVSVNGLIVDVRRMPRAIQEEAYRKGLIPYIPADGPPGA